MGLFTRARRPVQPSPVQATMYPGGEQFGPSPLPNVSQGVLLGLPAAWRAVNLIANGVASMSPLTGWKPDGITKIDDKPIWTRPDASMGTFDFWHSAVVTALIRGNYFGIKTDYDAAGFPQQVVSVHPNFCQVYMGGNGYLVYNIVGKTYTADEVVHVRGFTLPNTPRGLGVVENFRRQIGQMLDEQNMASSTFREGSVPSGILEFDKPVIDKEVARDVKDQWVANHGSGQRAPAVLPSSMKFTPLTWTPQDAEFLASRQFSVAELALMFNMDPSDLGAAIGGSSITYQNIQQRQVARITDTYAPWMRRFEEAWSDMVAGGNTVLFNPQNILRTDDMTRAQIDEINIATSVTTVDEAREQSRKPPLTKAQIEALNPASPVAPSGAPAVSPDGLPVNGAKPTDPIAAADAPVPIPNTHLSATPLKVKV